MREYLANALPFPGDEVALPHLVAQGPPLLGSGSVHLRSTMPFETMPAWRGESLATRESRAQRAPSPSMANTESSASTRPSLASDDASPPNRDSKLAEAAAVAHRREKDDSCEA
jgi:hypothetical protein